MKKKFKPVNARAFMEKVKYAACIIVLFFIADTVLAQKEKNICGITSQYSEFINKRVSEKIAQLRASGKLKNSASEDVRLPNALATPVSFKFPLADIKHRDYASWRMFNYLDLDPTSINDGTNINPNEIEDYNCGDRCYDYHSGIDILLEPYYWKEKMDESIWVIAAAPGVIVDKHDGEFDEQCDPPASICGTEPDNRGNYVVILHDDGSTASFYMHMVQSSLTTKQEGDRVNTGDFLGIAGSSGCSGGPHLHFEVRTGYVDAGLGYEATGTVVDPFANGSCAVSTSSWWASEPPYNDPAVLTMESHSADPESFVEGSDWCDQTVLLYPDNSFSAGQTMWLRTKLRDWLDGTTLTFRIYKPDGNLWRQYTRTNSTTQRGYIPTDAQYGFTSSDPAGTYRYTVTFGGKTYSHYFTKDCQYSIGISGAVSGQKGYMVSFSISSAQTISSSSSNYIKYMADDHVTLTPGFRATAGCRFVANLEGCNNSTANSSAPVAENEAPSGLGVMKESILNNALTNNLAISPNPSNGIFIISYKQEKMFDGLITIRAGNGKTVYTQQKNNAMQLQEKINLSNQAKGVYFIEVIADGQRLTGKVVLQ